MVCCVHFDFEMCFAPQRRALFRHLNFQNWSERDVFLAFSLANVLRATTACTFSTSQLPKVVRSWCALYILTSNCASRHNGVQLFTSHLASWLRTRRFSEPTFRPSGDTNHWKNTVFRDFPTFSRTWIFFLLTLSQFVIFFLLLFSDSAHLCFSSVHIVGSLTSKLPSTITYHYIPLHTSGTAQGGGGSFKIGNLWERLVVVNQGWQSEATDGLKGAWGLLSFSLFLWLSTYLPIYLLCIYLTIDLSLSLI